MTGILCLDKPGEMTSFTAVKRASRILGVKNLLGGPMVPKERVCKVRPYWCKTVNAL